MASSQHSPRVSEKLTVLTWLSKADCKNGADGANAATLQDLLAEARISVKSNMLWLTLWLTTAVFSF